MAPSPSHSQSLLPNPGILILDRIGHADRFRLRVHVEQEPTCPSVARCRDRVTAAMAAASRTSRGKACRFSCGRPSDDFAAAIPRVRARFSVSDCPGWRALTGVKPSGPLKSSDWSATWPAACRASDSSPDCPSPPVMTPFCGGFGSHRWSRDPRPVRNLGVDDWAWRKGQDYGTILVNLDLRRVVDLIPDRAAESFSAWLQQHPEIVTISRDRCGLYAEGATLGAPQSQQIADRFHLILNLSATMERVLEERSRQLILPPVEEPAAQPPPLGCLHRSFAAGAAPTDAVATAPSTPTGTLRASRRLVRVRPVPGGDQPHPGHGKEDDSALAATRRVSRTEAAAPSATEGE